MAKTYYLDTSIWRDYYENRSDKFRPLGEWALRLINKIIKDKDLILYSDFVVEELKVKYNEGEINNIFQVVGKSILKVNKASIEVDKIWLSNCDDAVAYSLALRLRSVHIVDCLIKRKMWSNKDFLGLIKKV